MKSAADKKQELIRTLFFSVLTLNAFVIFLVWLSTNWQQTTTNDTKILAIGSLLGLFLALSVLHQFLLQSRLPIMERYVGTMLAHRLHRYNAYLIFYLLLLHPLLITLAHSRLHDISYLQQSLDQIRYYPWVWLAYIAVFLLLSVIVLSINMVRRKLRYEYWYFIHLTVYIAVLTAFWHQITNGTSLLSSELFKVYWISLYLIILGTLAWYRFGQVVWRAYKYQFTVSKVVKEADGVVSIYISTKRPLPDRFFIPGQFGIWRFFAQRLWWQTHPFTISNGSGNQLRITPKAAGDYTSDLQQIKPGTKLFFDGPHGVFTTERLEGAKPLLIAGGIGITPIRAMLEGLGKRAKDSIIIYNVKGPADLALKAELETIIKKTGGKIYYIFSEKVPNRALKGQVDKALIKSLVKDVKSRKVAICGPPAMMNAVEQSLRELGVPKEHIYTERFAFTTK